MKIARILSLVTMILVSGFLKGQDKFAQLYDQLPTPNTTRTASGAPGKDYWQQRADYKIKVRLDDENQRIYGEEVVTYHNNSPDPLNYLWLQLDQNVRDQNSDTYKIRTEEISDNSGSRTFSRLEQDFDGGYKLTAVKDINGKDLTYTVNKTMMRIDLPGTLNPGQDFSFQIKYWYNINNTRQVRGRSGYEPFQEGNNVYVIAQFFPRMCAYNDVEGWQNKQFLGRGEFTLIFGDYEVEITAPDDHLVAATGLLQNADKVLTKEQRSLFKRAEGEHEQPVTISSLEEAQARMKQPSDKEKTWKFKAENVRDFAFASSRRFIWDAMGVPMSDGRIVMAQSMWIPEGDCLWNKYSTKAIAHTIKWYSHYTFDYPYPVAWSIDGNMGMEYPMIAFNNGRCDTDGTYTQRAKYGHIGVIIHEVGHNWFPMIVNSDERQWTWMDEGLNTFVQYLTEVQWEKDYPVRRGPANLITEYMGGDQNRISPIMTNSESIFQFGPNAYAKPATALNILRETIMGRELFDHAFKEYANRWKFKSPTPADFFRTMEDASAVDLDWFWRSWFYTTDYVDMSLDNFQAYQLDTQDPEVESAFAKEQRAKEPENISTIRNRETIKEYYADKDTTLVDFYSTYDPLDVNYLDKVEYDEFKKRLSEDQLEMLNSGKYYNQFEVKNMGGIPMPVIVEFTYDDETTEVFRIPAEVWRFDQTSITKVIPTDKKVVKVTLDPFLETADVDTSNNYYPHQQKVNRFDAFKNRRQVANPMQRDRISKEKEKNGRS
ncbi:MAG: M1 family metallopeptidase [Saprospiraceae bacterium]|nr:M1 family metallopeptidase [Saprospiraceae bacterium]